MAVDGLGFTLSKNLMDAAFGATSYTAPATVWLAALTTMPSDRAGTGLVEPTATNGYARLSVTNNTTNFSNATGTTGATKATGVALDFGTASGSWGTIVGVGISKVTTVGDNTGTNWLGFITFTSGVAISTNDVLELSSGAALKVDGG